MNKNLDILFLKNNEYNKASKILEENGFVLYLSENVEKYKRMYIKFSDEEYTRIHLHREIAWHGLKVINKNDVFNRIQNNWPTNEDQLIIHIAHCIFENFEFKDYQLKIVKNLLSMPLDICYIKNRVKAYGWKNEFKYVINKIKNDGPLSKMYFIRKFMIKVLFSPKEYYVILKKIIKIILRKLNLRRKGFLISLIGVNGSGKSTLLNGLLEKYHPLTNSVSGQMGYYFGWYPFTPLSKLLSKVLKKKKKELFKEVNKEKKETNNFSITQEILFLFLFIEFYIRYWCEVYPSLRKNKLVITDRYFYDLYTQYKYGEKSVILPYLFILFPKPDCVFILDAPADVLVSRGKVNEKRNVKSIENLKLQRRKFTKLSKKSNGFMILDTNEGIAKNRHTILKNTWKRVIQKKLKRGCVNVSF